MVAPITRQKAQQLTSNLTTHDKIAKDVKSGDKGKLIKDIQAGLKASPHFKTHSEKAQHSEAQAIANALIHDGPAPKKHDKSKKGDGLLHVKPGDSDEQPSRGVDPQFTDQAQAEYRKNVAADETPPTIKGADGRTYKNPAWHDPSEPTVTVDPQYSDQAQAEARATAAADKTPKTIRGADGLLRNNPDYHDPFDV